MSDQERIQVLETELAELKGRMESAGEVARIAREMVGAFVEMEREVKTWRADLAETHAQANLFIRKVDDVVAQNEAMIATLDPETVKKQLDGFSERLLGLAEYWKNFEERNDTMLSKKVEALGGQVMKLLDIGDRMGRAEKMAKDASAAAKSALESNEGLGKRLDDLAKRVSMIFAPKEKKEPKPEPEKTEKG